MNILLSIGIVLFTAIGQVFLKKGALTSKHLFINRYVFLGYFTFILVMIMSITLMHSLKFKYFSTIVSLNYLATIVLARIILQEKMKPNVILACLMITVGCIIFNL